MSSNYELKEAAKLRGEVTYQPAKPCRRGHLSPRYTSNSNCIECMRGTVSRAPKPSVLQTIRTIHLPLNKDMPTEMQAFLETMLIENARIISEHWGHPMPVNGARLRWAIENKKLMADCPF